MVNLLSQKMHLSVEKIYKIDDAGNADVERKWILSNPSSEDIDLNDYGLVLTETVNTMGNLKVFDSKGSLEYTSEDKGGDDIEVFVKPRIKKIGCYQDYEIILQYHLPSFVHKLGGIWLFTDTMIGMIEDPESPFPKRMDAKLQVVLPKLKKTFLQRQYHESCPHALDQTREKNQRYNNKTILEWKCSLSSKQRFPFQLFYGIETNAKITTFITTIVTTIIVALINLGFNLLSKGVI
jgi:hypothetical protein